MKRIVIVIVVFIAVAAAAWFFVLRGASVELRWGGDWPKALRATGESVERVVHAGHGKPTAADRARARERARWKAYYYAQLRLAEQLGGLHLDAHTTVRDAALMDREIKAAWAGTIRAAAEAPSGSTVEDLPDAVRVRVTVEAPAGRVLGLREAIVRALAGGRIQLKLPARSARSEASGTAETPLGTSAGMQRQQPASTPARDRKAARQRTPEVTRPSAHPVRREKAPELRYTGCVLHLPETPETLVAAPDFYDAAGVYLGSALDLPEGVRATGIPVAGPGDAGRIRKIAGARPVELEAVVTAGNIMIQSKLSPREAELFAAAIRHNRVVLVLGEGVG